MASSVLPFLQRDRSFIAVWSGEEDCVMEVFGERIHVPPTEDVSDFGQPGSKYRFPPAKDSAGRPIPGTVVLSDKWARDRNTQQDVKQFDVSAFLEHLHKHNPALLNRGLTIVADANDIEAVREAGKPKWLAAKVGEWEATIRAELTRQDLWAKRGQPAPESSSAKAVKEAIAGLATARKKLGTSISKDELLNALGAGPAVPVPFSPAEVTTDDEAVDEEKAARDLYSEAKKIGVFLKKEEIEGLFTQDIDVMDAVAEKIRTAKAV
jgi:hypothetical protein